MTKFVKPEFDPELNPVDYFNIYVDWIEIFKGEKVINWDSHDRISINGVETFQLGKHGLRCVESNILNFEKNKYYSKFMTLTKLKFKGNYKQAISHVELTMLNAHIPYIRVGTDYFKLFKKKDRYNVERDILKAWRKEEIKEDHGKNIFSVIHRFDDFCIEPNNLEHEQVIDNCYNLYAKFSHSPSPGDCTNSLNLMRHIFGDQYELGLNYLKILYEMPKQALPVLCLVSSERQTGKTTFMNWINIIFGDNFCLINPEDLASSFNSSYAYKNIIGIDETVIDKIASVEKLKSLATGKTISVNQKFIANYSLPFFGKIIISTNKEKDFMRIDEEEIRFWVRKINTIDKINTNIEDDLTKEIPAFLYYLEQLPSIDLTKSRMVFTADELKNEFLEEVKSESINGLQKEIYCFIQDIFFQDKTRTELFATAIDIKTAFFEKQSNIGTAYIRTVLKEKMKLLPLKLQRYEVLNQMDGGLPKSKSGIPFKFERKDFVQEEEEITVVFDDNPPF